MPANSFAMRPRSPCCCHAQSRPRRYRAERRSSNRLANFPEWEKRHSQVVGDSCGRSMLRGLACLSLLVGGGPMVGRWLLVGVAIALCTGQASAQTQLQAGAAVDHLKGTSLYADVTHYASFGLHRFGSPGDKATTDWIAGELKAAGFRVAFQPVVLGKQYVVERAHARVSGVEIAATPFWWPPDHKAAFRLAAPLVRDGDAAGKILWVELPYDRGAYRAPAHRAAVRQAGAGGRAAILLVIGTPADDRFA